MRLASVVFISVLCQFVTSFFMWADCPLGLVQFCFVAFAMTTSRERLCKENKGNTTFL